MIILTPKVGRAFPVRELIRAAKAVSDESRVRMLKLLLERDICVCEMHEVFPLSHSQVSRNLKMLMEAGFLKRWHEGKCVVYIANKENSNPYCRAILDVIADSFNKAPAVRQDRAKLQDVIARQIRTGNK